MPTAKSQAREDDPAAKFAKKAASIRCPCIASQCPFCLGEHQRPHPQKPSPSRPRAAPPKSRLA
eukprot:12934171-Prorocentrum_lima.AAC.1